MNNTNTREASVEIAASPETVWQAITNPELTRNYYFGTDILSDWRPRSDWTSETDGHVYLEGKILEIEPNHRLVQSFRVVDEAPANTDSPSKVTWVLTATDTGTLLSVIHEDIAQATFDYTDGGWEHILAGLKAVAEGRPAMQLAMG